MGFRIRLPDAPTVQTPEGCIGNGAIIVEAGTLRSTPVTVEADFYCTGINNGNKNEVRSHRLRRADVTKSYLGQVANVTEAYAAAVCRNCPFNPANLAPDFPIQHDGPV